MTPVLFDRHRRGCLAGTPAGLRREDRVPTSIQTPRRRVVQCVASGPAALSAGRTGQARSPDAADHLPRRSELRGGGRHRRRCPGQLRAQSGKADFQIFESGKLQTISRLPPSVFRWSAPSVLVLHQGDSARCAIERRGPERPDLRAVARRHAHRSAPVHSRAQGGEAVHHAQPGLKRPDGGAADQRQARRQPGLHRQPAAAAGRRRQVHGPEAPVNRPQQDGRVQPAARHRAGKRPDQGCRRTATGLQRQVHAVHIEERVRVPRRCSGPA